MPISTFPILSFMGPEEKSFENVDDRQTDGWLMPAYTISSSKSLWLRWANNMGHMQRQQKMPISTFPILSQWKL